MTARRVSGRIVWLRKDSAEQARSVPSKRSGALWVKGAMGCRRWSPSNTSIWLGGRRSWRMR
jgi:hypothetical protein